MRRKRTIIGIISTILVAAAIVICCFAFGGNPIKNIFLDTSETQLLFDINEDFNYTGLVVRGQKDSGDYEELDGYEIDASKFKKGKLGTYEIEISYKGLIEKYFVQVKDRGTLSITKNISFYKGQNFSNNSPEITYTDSYGQTAVITDYEIVSFNTNSLGTHTATLTSGGFEYQVEYEVIENDKFFENLVDNTLSEVSAEEIKFFEMSFWHYGYPDKPSEYHNTVYTDDYVYKKGSLSGDRSGWAMKDGLAIMVEDGNITTQQFATQEEALQAVTTFTDTGINLYTEYTNFVYAAKALIQTDGLEYSATHETNGTRVTINISMQEGYYVVVYNTKTGVIEDVKIYVNDFLMYIYRFNTEVVYADYLPPVG